MAVALATLPLNRVLAGAGGVFLVAATKAGLTADFAAALVLALTGVTAGFAACFVIGLAGAAFLTTAFGDADFFATAFFATVFLTTTFLTAGFLAIAFFTATFFVAVFLTATFFTAAFLTAAFLTAVFPTAVFFTGVFFTGVFFATGLLAADFLTTAFLTTAFLTAAFFTAGFFTIGFFTATFFAAVCFAWDFLAAGFFTGVAFLTGDLVTNFRAAADFAATLRVVALLATFRPDFADVLRAFFTIRPLPPAVVDLPTLTSAAPAEVLPFGAVAAMETSVASAISRHRFILRRPGVISQPPYTGKLASGILVPLPAASRPGTVNILTRFILWMLRLYKRWLSPLLGPHCRFHPSCSAYAQTAVVRFGPWRGSLLTAWRLLRCQPLCHGGHDPVPEQFHFTRCRHHGKSAGTD